MLVIVKSESVVTGTLVAADRVLTDMLTSAIVRRAFVLIYKRPQKKPRRQTAKMAYAYGNTNNTTQLWHL